MNTFPKFLPVLIAGVLALASLTALTSAWGYPSGENGLGMATACRDARVRPDMQARIANIGATIACMDGMAPIVSPRD
jgi:hypothetical protein